MSEEKSTAAPTKLKVSDLYERMDHRRVRAAIEAARGSRSTAECWAWRQSVRKDRPYGFLFVSVAGKKRGLIPSKCSFIVHGGSIPKPGQVVMHSCDTPSCVNPAHLSLGTHAQNMADAASKGRIIKAPKIHAFTVVAIRQLRVEGVSDRAIAVRLNIPRNTVRKIARGDTRASIQLDDTL